MVVEVVVVVESTVRCCGRILVVDRAAVVVAIVVVADVEGVDKMKNNVQVVEARDRADASKLLA